MGGLASSPEQQCLGDDSLIDGDGFDLGNVVEGVLVFGVVGVVGLHAPQTSSRSPRSKTMSPPKAMTACRRTRPLTVRRARSLLS